MSRNCKSTRNLIFTSKNEVRCAAGFQCLAIAVASAMQWPSNTRPASVAHRDGAGRSDLGLLDAAVVFARGFVQGWCDGGVLGWRGEAAFAQLGNSGARCLWLRALRAKSRRSNR